MAPINRTCTTFYWSDIVLSVTDFELLHVQEYRDLQIYVRITEGHWKWVPFDILRTVSYSHSIATMAVSLTVSTQYTNVTSSQPSQDSKGHAYA